MAAPAVVYRPPTVSQGEGHVYDVPVPPPSPITPKPAPSDRQRQKLLVTAIVGVFLVAGCLLGLLAAIVVRIPASGDRQGAVNQELMRSPIECPVACPSVRCPELVCPSVSCPELACPSVPCPELACPSVPCPAVACPSVPCPELGCPSVPCPQLTCPSVDISCPAISCPIMSPVTSCDDGFVRRDGSNSCYKLINVAKTRPEAAAECARHGAYLVEIGSQEEQTFIERLIALISDTYVWTGAIRLPPASSSTFFWQHSKQLVAEGVTFTNWVPGEPERIGQMCSALSHGHGFRWIDVFCSEPSKIVCEKNLQ